jgi:hypothetical protein
MQVEQSQTAAQRDALKIGPLNVAIPAEIR